MCEALGWRKLPTVLWSSLKKCPVQLTLGRARKRKHKKMFAQEILMTEPNILLFLMFIVKLRHLFVK